jgi:hypothetical protein
MVCDGAMIASTLVSVMMNGVCCMWQKEEEKDRREAFRQDIRTEYWNQRLIDHELRMQELINDPHDERDSGDHELSFLQDARRRKLLLDKMNASDKFRKQAAKTVDIIPPSPVSETKTPKVSNRRRANSSPRVSPANTHQGKRQCTFVESPRRTASLVDEDDDSGDELLDELGYSFTEIKLD